MRVASSMILAIGIAAVSTASILIRYAQVEAPSLVIATYRMAIASLVLAPVAWRTHRTELRSMSNAEWWWAIASGVFLAVHFAAWITSLEYTSVASSVVLVTTSPLWVAVAGRLFLRERLSRSVIFGLILAVAGGTVIGLSDALQESGSAPLLGNVLALVGAITVAGYWLIGRRLRGRLSLVPYVTVVYSTAAAVLLMMTTAVHESLTGYPPVIYLLFLLLALVPQLIGHSSFNWALARLPAVFVAIATLGEPIGSATLAYLFLGETPTLLKISGAALILAGIALTLFASPTARPMDSTIN